MKALIALGTDFTYFYQLGLIVFFYFVFKYLFLGKLLLVLQTREDQTTKRTDGASNKMLEVQSLNEEYEKKILNAHKDAQSLLSEKKQEVVKRENLKLKEAEQKLAQKLEEQRKVLKSEVESIKEKTFESTTSLSSELVTKILQ